MALEIRSLPDVVSYEHYISGELPRFKKLPYEAQGFPKPTVCHR